MYDTLILAGNSTNAIVTLGALQYLYDNKLLRDIKSFFGTSSGSILNLLLIIGYEPIDILIYICIEKVYKDVQINFSNMLLAGKSVMCFEPIKKSLETLIIERVGHIPTMGSLIKTFGKEMVVTTYNLTDDKREYLSSSSNPDLSVLHAIRMSSTFPFLFEPYKYNDKLYLDGGIVDNFPIEYEIGKYGNRLGIITLSKKIYSCEFGYIDFIHKLFQVFITTMNNDKINRTNFDIIKIDTNNNFFNFDSTNNELIEMFDQGYDMCNKWFVDL
jgi:NTE family protein